MAYDAGGMIMLEFNPNPLARSQVRRRSVEGTGQGQSGDQSLEAKVKPDCVHLYPGVDPKVWYKVVQEGEYRDDMEGLWIQVSDWVTYVLAKHFDLQSRTATH
jgi:hypothetical protein